MDAHDMTTASDFYKIQHISVAGAASVFRQRNT